MSSQIYSLYDLVPENNRLDAEPGTLLSDEDMLACVELSYGEILLENRDLKALLIEKDQELDTFQQNFDKLNEQQQLQQQIVEQLTADNDMLRSRYICNYETDTFKTIALKEVRIIFDQALNAKRDMDLKYPNRINEISSSFQQYVTLVDEQMSQLVDQYVTLENQNQQFVDSVKGQLNCGADEVTSAIIKLKESVSSSKNVKISNNTKTALQVMLLEIQKIKAAIPKLLQLQQQHSLNLSQNLVKLGSFSNFVQQNEAEQLNIILKKSQKEVSSLSNMLLESNSKITQLEETNMTLTNELNQVQKDLKQVQLKIQLAGSQQAINELMSQNDNKIRAYQQQIDDLKQVEQTMSQDLQQKVIQISKLVQNQKETAQIVQERDLDIEQYKINISLTNQQKIDLAEQLCQQQQIAESNVQSVKDLTQQLLQMKLQKETAILDTKQLTENHSRFIEQMKLDFKEQENKLLQQLSQQQQCIRANDQKQQISDNDIVTLKSRIYKFEQYLQQIGTLTIKELPSILLMITKLRQQLDTHNINSSLDEINSTLFDMVKKDNETISQMKSNIVLTNNQLLLITSDLQHLRQTVQNHDDFDIQTFIVQFNKQQTTQLQKYDQLNQSVTSYEQQHLRDVQTIKELQIDISNIKSQIFQLEREKSDYFNEKHELTSQNNQLQNEIKQQSNISNMQAIKIKEKQNRLDEIQKLMDMTSENLMKQGETSQQHSNELLKKLNEAESNIEQKDAKLKEQLILVEQLENVNNVIKAQLNDLRYKQEKLQSSLSEMEQSQKLSAMQLSQTFDEQISKKIDESKDLQLINEDLQQQLSCLVNKYQQLKIDNEQLCLSSQEKEQINYKEKECLSTNLEQCKQQIKSLENDKTILQEQNISLNEAIGQQQHQFSQCNDQATNKINALSSELLSLKNAYQEVESQNYNANAKITTISEEMVQCKLVILNYEKQLNENKSDIILANEQIKSLQQQFLEKERLHEEQMASIMVSKQIEQNQFSSKIQDKDAVIEQLQQKLQLLNIAVEELKSDKQKSIDELNERLTISTQQLEKKIVETETKSLNQINATSKQVEELEEKKKELQNQLQMETEELKKQNEGLLLQLEQMQADVNQLELSKMEVCELLKSHSKIDNVQSEMTLLIDQNQAFQEEITRKTQEMKRIAREFSAFKQQCEAKQMEHENEIKELTQKLVTSTEEIDSLIKERVVLKKQVVDLQSIQQRAKNISPTAPKTYKEAALVTEQEERLAQIAKLNKLVNILKNQLQIQELQIKEQQTEISLQIDQIKSLNLKLNDTRSLIKSDNVKVQLISNQELAHSLADENKQLKEILRDFRQENQQLQSSKNVSVAHTPVQQQAQTQQVQQCAARLDATEITIIELKNKIIVTQQQMNAICTVFDVLLHSLMELFNAHQQNVQPLVLKQIFKRCGRNQALFATKQLQQLGIGEDKCSKSIQSFVLWVNNAGLAIIK